MLVLTRPKPPSCGLQRKKESKRLFVSSKFSSALGSLMWVNVRKFHSFLVIFLLHILPRHGSTCFHEKNFRNSKLNFRDSPERPKKLHKHEQRESAVRRRDMSRSNTRSSNLASHPQHTLHLASLESGEGSDSYIEKHLSNI